MEIQCFIWTCADDLNLMHIQHVKVYVSADDISHLQRHTMFHMYLCRLLKAYAQSTCVSIC
jgi:hypothetical protein